MQKPDRPANEARRLEVLKGYDILDTLPEQDFDDLTKLAAMICKTPVALITLLDESRSWFKSAHGVQGTESPRETSFCAHTILQDRVFIVPDASADERFFDNPDVTGGFNVQFYAGAPLIAPTGERIGSICVVDHTARTLSEEQALALKQIANQVISQCELRKRITEVEVTKQELRVAAEMAVQAAHAKSQFLANMSHEIRTPMNGIIGLTELLAESPLNSEQANSIRIIGSCGRTLLNLINDILDFSKIESNKIELELRPFQIAQTLRDVVEIFSSTASSKGLKVELSIDREVPDWLIGDSNRLSQISSNLLSNAIKFTDRGGVHIRVSSKARGPATHEISVAFTDTGIGIPYPIQSKLFQSFVQADASTTRRFGGSGLGLAISKALSERMGGTIHLKSEPDHGSTFTFTLLADATTMPVEIKKPESEHASKQKARLRIILAEDNQVNQVVGLAMLKKLGYDAEIAADGQEVLKLLATNTYDLILMDRHMPRLDGVQATEEIFRRIPEASRPRIVAMTASALKEDEEICRAAGMADFLTKPVSLADLSRVLNAALTG